jgi:hypothetical protein
MYPADPANPTFQSVQGIALTNFSGSMAGANARATFTIKSDGTAQLNAIVGTGRDYKVNDVLEASFGGLTVHITVNQIAHLNGWQLTVASIESNGVHGLKFTNNIVYDWAPGGPSDTGGTHDSPGGVLGSGAANIWSPNQINLPASTYPDPTRNLESYAALLGLPASVDGYANAALANAKWNYDKRLTARAFNDWVRAGFGMPAIG